MEHHQQFLKYPEKVQILNQDHCQPDSMEEGYIYPKEIDETSTEFSNN